MLRSKSETLFSLQCLRALAVLFVVYAHSGDQIAGKNFIEREFGHFGVDLFFVLSGFIMVYISNRRPKPPLAFLRDRVVRIVPLYWFYNALVIAILLIAPSVFRNTTAEPLHVLRSLLFIPHANPATGSYSPLLRLGWTLNFEMFFYLIFAIAMAFSFSKRVFMSTSVIMGLVVIGLVFQSSISNLPIFVQFYTSTIILEFAFGMWIAQIYVRGSLPSLPVWVAGPLIALCLVLVGSVVGTDWSGPMRGLVWGPLAGLIVWSSLSFEPVARLPALAWLVTIGNASYTIYLMHLFPISAFRLVWQRLGGPEGTMASQAAFQLSIIILVSVLGVIAYRWIETPLVRYATAFFEWGGRRLAGKKTYG